MALVNTVNYAMLANMLLIVPVIAFIALYLSHKIAGPAYRLEHYLSDMADGKLKAHVTLRKGDELVNIAAKINNLTDSLRNTILNQRTSLDNIVTELKAVKGLVDAKTANIGEIDENIERITKEILALERELDRFKM